MTLCTISRAATDALASLLRLPVAKTPKLAAVGDVTPLADALRDALNVRARATAADVLILLGTAIPSQRKGMAAAGVLTRALTLYVESWNSPRGEKLAAPVKLGRLLVWGETVAASKLAILIRAPQAEHAFHALVFLGVRRSVLHTVPGPVAREF
jgi:hypothetical protein